jgi:hypothetical protein
MFRRPILLLVLLLILGAGAATLWFAAFPPPVTPTAVERILPTDRFQLR